jgi:hypothetical protein
MTFEEFKRLIEADFGPTDSGMLGELVDTVENMVAGGGSDLATAITNAAQEMRDTLADIQRLGSEDLDDEDTDEFDEALDEEEGDDCCDNCMTSGIACPQTCPDCGKTLCAACAADNEGRCSECSSSADGTGDDEPDEDDEASHADH